MKIVSFIAAATALASAIAASIACGQSNPVLPSPDPEPLHEIELIWHDLYGDDYVEQEYGFYFRPDIEVVDGDNVGYKVQVLDVTADNEVTGVLDDNTYFVEHSRYPSYFFIGSTSTFTENGITAHATAYLDYVSGTLVGPDGTSRIVVGMSHIIELQGTALLKILS